MAIIDPELERKPQARPDADQQWRAPAPDQPATSPGGRSAASRWRLVVTPLAKVAGAVGRFLDFTIFSSLTRRIIVLNMAPA